MCTVAVRVVAVLMVVALGGGSIATRAVWGQTPAPSPAPATSTPSSAPGTFCSPSFYGMTNRKPWETSITTWKVSCNLLNLRKQFAEEFFRAIFISP
jgi:hypothetical protein